MKATQVLLQVVHEKIHHFLIQIWKFKQHRPHVLRDLTAIDFPSSHDFTAQEWEDKEFDLESEIKASS